jgi:hypothetical protein
MSFLNQFLKIDEESMSSTGITAEKLERYRNNHLPKDSNDWIKIGIVILDLEHHPHKPISPHLAVPAMEVIQYNPGDVVDHSHLIPVQKEPDPRSYNQLSEEQKELYKAAVSRQWGGDYADRLEHM